MARTAIADNRQLIIRKVTGRLENSSSTQITAPSVTGYDFLCWISIASKGSVVPIYIANADTKTSSVWNSNNSVVTTDFSAIALYQPKIMENI